MIAWPSFPIQSWFAIVAPGLKALTGAAEQRRLFQFAQLAPPGALAILEAHLAAGGSRIDLSLRLVASGQARDLAAGLSDPLARSFLTRWAERQGPRVPVWLEFDLDEDREALPPPLLCAQLPPDADPLWLADSLLPALHGRRLTPAQRDLVLRCACAVPPPARLLYAFSLLPRPGAAVRLEILGLGPAAAAGYLSRVAPHVLPTVAEIGPLLGAAENPHLSFDIGEEVLPRIGFEGAFPRQPPREPRWAELLGQWVEKGLCAPEKRDAILAWPGQDSFWTAPERWPVETLGAGGRLVRFLSHLKVVGQPGRPPEAKAYLGLLPVHKSSTR